MVMSSTEIAQLHASFQQQSMMQMQQAQMISQHGGRMSLGEQFTGAGINRGAAIGAPMAAAGMGLMGLDPFSMGIRGAMMGSRMGVGGAIGMGAMGAGLMAAPMMAAQYAGGQMMEGMQQQQMLQGQLRSSYTFANGMGKGFSAGEMGDIGGSIRQMSGQRNLGGEIMGFDELGRMASMMGRMGMAEGVKGARDFNDKFKQLVTTVKEVAQSLSTTLEDGMQIMNSMKSSGIFKNQGAIAGQIKGYALGGGLATSEITSMMGIGSQISRSIGGRGAAGAMGGMQTIGQIGLARQMGAISEEDIYNATGLTGAEGRQAMATQMMQSSAGFLKGGLGRRFLASMAGKNGQLDQNAVEEYMHGGGVGTGRTMELAGQNLGKVGRANFIRNEGRLRGEALGQFGGLANVTAMRGWLEERGFDLTSGQDDRAAIFMQRRLGMGSDEADTAIKMARNLPQLLRGQQNASEDAKYRQQTDQMRSNMGLDGVKKKFETARNDLQNELRQAGAVFFEESSNLVDSWVNELTGNHASMVSANVGGAIREAMSGGAYSKTVQRTRFGIGSSLGSSALGQAGRQGIFGGTSSMSMGSAFNGSGDAARFSKAGYGFSGGSDASIAQGLSWAQGVQGAFQEGASSEMRLGEGAVSELRMAMANGRLKGGGANQLSAFGRTLESSKNEELRALGLSFGNMSTEERARAYGSAMSGAGMGSFGASAMALPDQQALYGQGGFHTEKDMDLGIGRYMFKDASANSGLTREKMAFGRTRGQMAGAVAGGMAGMATNEWGMGSLGVLGIAGNALGLGKKVRGEISGQAEDKYNEQLTGISRGVMESSGRFLRSDAGMSAARDIYEGGDWQRSAAVMKLQDRNMELQSRAQGRSMDDIEAGEFEANRALMMGSEYLGLMKATGGAEPSDSQKQDIVRRTGAASWEDLVSRASAGAGVLSKKQDEERTELFRRVGEKGREGMASLRKGGFYSGGQLTSKARLAGQKVGASSEVSAEKFGGMLGYVGSRKGNTMQATTGEQYMALVAQATTYESMMAPGSDEMNQVNFGLRNSSLSDADAISAGMSVKDKRALASSLSGMGGTMGDQRRALLSDASTQDRLDKAKGRSGTDVAMANMLGLNASAGDRAKFAKMSPEELASQLVDDAGGGLLSGEKSESMRTDLAAALKASRSGKTGEAAQSIRGLSERFGEADRARQDESSKEKDPAYRKMSEIAESMKAVAKAVSSPLSVTVLGGNINTIAATPS